MEDGRYTMRGIAGALGKANTGTVQIGVELEVTQGESQGERITYYGFFTANAQEYTFRTMRDLGWEGDDLTNLAGLDKNEVTVYVGTEEWKGELKQKVKAIYPLGGAGIANPLTEAEAKVLAAQLKGAAIASRGPKPASKPKAKKPAPQDSDSTRGAYGGAGSSDDDIPFIFCDVARMEGERWWRW